MIVHCTSTPRLSMPRAAHRWPSVGLPIFLALVWCLGVALFEMLKPQGGDPLSLCLFRNLTGLPCPTCGSTRLVVAASQGRLSEAFAANPLVFAAIAGGVMLGGLRLAGWRVARAGLSRSWRVAGWSALVVLVLANWAYLIARDAPPVFGGG